MHRAMLAGPDLKDFIDRSRNRAKELNDKDKPLLEIMPGQGRERNTHAG